jgi:hypothetical protein
MKLKSRIAGSATALALALGMSAAPAFATSPSNPPTAGAGETAYPQGTQVDRGNCSGLLIGAIGDPANKLQGLTNNLGPISSSSKGYATDLTNPTNLGTCTTDGRIGFTGDDTGVSGTYKNTVVKTVTKAGTKLTSSNTTCSSDSNGNGTPRETAAFPTGDFNPSARALSGKLSYAFSDLSKMDAYIRVQGFDQAELVGADIIWLTGIVIKGQGVGTTIGGNVWFNPIFKAKLATTAINTIGHIVPVDGIADFVIAATTTGTSVTITTNINPAYMPIVGDTVTTTGLASANDTPAVGITPAVELLNGDHVVTAVTPGTSLTSGTISFVAAAAPGAVTDASGAVSGKVDQAHYDFVDPFFGRSKSVAVGYGTNAGFALGQAFGCTTGAAGTANNLDMGAGITSIAIGAQFLDPLLGVYTSDGIRFLL